MPNQLEYSMNQRDLILHRFHSSRKTPTFQAPDAATILLRLIRPSGFHDPTGVTHTRILPNLRNDQSITSAFGTLVASDCPSTSLPTMVGSLCNIAAGYGPVARSDCGFMLRTPQKVSNGSSA